MFKLRIGYLITGIVTGLMLLFSFLATLPDGKLHIVFCDVGQGDAAYVRFADGRDMVVDGGPNDRVLQCLGRHMPFWDRHINIVAMTHPQKDHMQGLISVLDRYDVDYFVRSDIDNTTEGYQKLQAIIKTKNIPVKFVTRGERIDVGTASLSLLWPSRDQIARGSVLGVQSQPDLNDGSLVFLLRYGTFDALFTGDADSRVEQNYIGTKLALSGAEGLADDVLEVLKVPHHGSRTGMTDEFVRWLRPGLSIISVGKNSYGHPSPEILNKLALIGSRVLRTDQEGDIEVVSDGKGWEIIK